MSSARPYNSPFSQFSRIAGRYNSLAPFFIMSGNQQIVTGSNDVDVSCFHTKMYTTDEPITLKLNNGYQDGQLKKMTFVFKGSETANVVLECPALTDTYSQVTFNEVGDQLLLMWTGGSWCVLETLNITDPSLNSPVVE